MMRLQTAAVRWPSCDASQPPRLRRASRLPRLADHHRLSRARPRVTATADALVSAPAAVALADDFMQVGSRFEPGTVRRACVAQVCERRLHL